jgi:hypothetical protein
MIGSASRTGRGVRRLLVTTALALAAILGSQAAAEATSYFGSGGKGYVSALQCLGGGRVRVEVTIWQNQHPQALARDLYYWSGGTRLLAVGGLSDMKTNYAATASYWETTITFPDSRRIRTIDVYYWWYQNGWQQGSPAGERFSIVC